MKKRNRPVPARQKLRTFVQNAAGIAAVEFAYILPLLLLAYYGLIEISAGVRASKKLDLAAYTLGDLVSRLPSVNGGAAQLTDGGANGESYGISQVFAAAAAVMSPYPASTLEITVSEVLISLNGNGVAQATVDWTVTSSNSGTQRNTTGCQGITLGGTALQIGTPLQSSNAAPVSFTTMPTSYTAGSSPQLGPYIVTDIIFTYKPSLMPLSWLFGGSNGVTMQRTQYTQVLNTYAATTYPYLRNHIQYALSTTPYATNCLSPTP
jgi:Flp pilus assembly protein TadG